jgi:hypothetical protein
MPETSAGKVIVGDFDHVYGLYRLPFRRAFRRPPARTAWGISRKALIVSNGFKRISQSGLVLGLDSRRKSDVME